MNENKCEPLCVLETVARFSENSGVEINLENRSTRVKMIKAWKTLATLGMRVG